MNLEQIIAKQEKKILENSTEVFVGSGSDLVINTTKAIKIHSSSIKEILEGVKQDVETMIIGVDKELHEYVYSENYTDIVGLLFNYEINS